MFLLSFITWIVAHMWGELPFDQSGLQAGPPAKQQPYTHTLKTSTHGLGTPLDLSPFYNAKAASTGFGDPLADFDGSGRAYPAEWLPEGPFFVHGGIKFALPPFHDSNKLDTVRTGSQVLDISHSDVQHYQSFHALATAAWPATASPQHKQGSITFTFIDGTTSTAGFVVGPWWSINPFDGPITTPFFYANSTLDYNRTISYNATSISYVSLRVPNAKPLRSVSLPDSATCINFFAISLLSASPNASQHDVRLTTQNVRSTTKWMDEPPSQPDDTDMVGAGRNKIQQVEVTLTNLALLNASTATWVTRAHNLTVWLESDAFDTVIPGRVVRLRNNDQVVVRIGVRNRAEVRAGTDAWASVILQSAEEKSILLDNGDGWKVVAGIPEWTSSDESLRTHEAPEWFDDAKFGIFIHWGVYSVPAWAPSGLQYAEWYNWQFHNPASIDSPTWVRHLDIYGPDVVYDDFIANWTASAWDPDDWVDLFSDAGAKYFVIVTKHHDGFALFDTGNSSHRNSIRLGPKRDVVKELFTSAKSRHPELHRGTYFSIPEWFNPAWQPHGEINFPGGPALNPFNGSCCDPYIGYLPVTDFLTEVQKPQLESLFYEHDTEILWCDIGGDSIFPAIGATWYNYAASQGRQVAVNNRCGANQSDFVTPEYATFGAPLSQKWESSAGMDPYSYGYNSDTPPEAYQNASSIITELIDIVSKGGNFLIDIGPMQDGTIIPEERYPLLEVGAWLKHSGASIYETSPWFIQPADSTVGMTDVRFTTAHDTFYIIALSRPIGGTLRTLAPVPIMEGDQVVLLGGSGKSLLWEIDTRGVLHISADDEELDRVRLSAWAFEVRFAQ